MCGGGGGGWYNLARSTGFACGTRATDTTVAGEGQGDLSAQDGSMLFPLLHLGLELGAYEFFEILRVRAKNFFFGPSLWERGGGGLKGLCSFGAV